MEIIDIDTATKELIELGADETYRELVLNNVRLYNQLVLDYTIEGITKNLYLTYQLNVQITKQLTELRKMPPKKTAEEEDDFTKLVKGLKPDKPTENPEPTKPPKKKK